MSDLICKSALISALKNELKKFGEEADAEHKRDGEVSTPTVWKIIGYTYALATVKDFRTIIPEHYGMQRGANNEG